MRALNKGGLGCGSEDRGKGNGREREMRDGGKNGGRKKCGREKREKHQQHPFHMFPKYWNQ